MTALVSCVRCGRTFVQHFSAEPYTTRRFKRGLANHQRVCIGSGSQATFPFNHTFSYPKTTL